MRRTTGTAPSAQCVRTSPGQGREQRLSPALLQASACTQQSRRQLYLICACDYRKVGLLYSLVDLLGQCSQCTSFLRRLTHQNENVATHRAPAAAYLPSADMPALLSKALNAVSLQLRGRPMAGMYACRLARAVQISPSYQWPNNVQAREPCVVSKEQGSKVHC